LWAVYDDWFGWVGGGYECGEYDNNEKR